MSLDILRCLDIREHIVLQILELRLLLGFLQIAIRQHIIAETAVHRRIIDEATLMVSCHNLIICRIEYHRAQLLQQIHAEALVLIIRDYKGATKFIIPNEVVRDQMYTYLLDTYKENDLTYDSFNKGKLESQLAYDGNYKAYFEFIADCLKRYSSQRDKQKGEAFVHGFTLAMTSQNQFYRPISELDNDGGYADIFLSPLCDIYKDMVDSYIIELKYCKTNTADEQLQVLFKEASVQICRYANSDIVKESVKTTKLHKLVVIYRGAEMVMCEEVTEE